MTWNVLFSNYTSNHTQYCDPIDMDTEYRIGMVVAAVLEHQPTILALQECECDTATAPGSHWPLLRDALKEAGYVVHHQEKIFPHAVRFSPDAIALAFRHDDVAPTLAPFGHKLLPHKPQVALIGSFELRRVRDAAGQPCRLVVATTHLSAAKPDEDVRCNQMASLLQQIKDVGIGIAQPENNAPPAAIPVIVLGDLNTEPRWELIPGLEAGSAVGPLRDAYANRDGRPPGYTDTPFTSYSWFLQGVADYVLHTDGVVPLRVLKVPGVREVSQLYAADYPQRRGTLGPRFEMLPTKSFPSDHVPLMVEFGFESRDRPPMEVTGTAATL